MFSHYDLIVAQDRADRIASAGYNITGSAGREFEAEDIARRMREIRKHGGGWLRGLLGRLGLVSETASAPVSVAKQRQADIVRVAPKSDRPVTATGVETKKAA